ncbi:hypothetical protein [Jannaschia sp. M317]|uniref:hypothetical protein n=1 Tax=Jannaschia sp. M317 TaxID=2867011 RepID=UPI0021A2C55E|nr:hypothetical protein [Jannaschia sp. M317]UWQ17994.1 hypothetical protein K3551_01415 [Jannaschia sp. M317]
MTYLVKSALLVAALSAPLIGGIAPAYGAGSAATAQETQADLKTYKSDRGDTPTRAQLIFAALAAESDD